VLWASPQNPPRRDDQFGPDGPEGDPATKRSAQDTTHGELIIGVQNSHGDHHECETGQGPAHSRAEQLLSSGAVASDGYVHAIRHRLRSNATASRRAHTRARGVDPARSTR